MKTRYRMNLARAASAAFKNERSARKKVYRKLAEEFDEEGYESNDSDYASTAPSSAQVTPEMRPKRKRKRKSTDQIKVLKVEFQANPTWSKEQVAELSKRTGLSESQVYKWGWDYKKKLRLEGYWGNEENLICHETLMPSALDLAIYDVQRAYRIHMKNWNYSCTPTRFLAAPLLIS